MKKGISNAMLIREIVTSGAGSRQELCRGLKTSKATISRVVDRLLRTGYLEEGVKTNAGNPGRRGPRIVPLRVRPDLVYLLGADLEGLAVRACLLDGARRVMASGKREVDGHWSMNRIVREWVALIEEVLEVSGVPRDRIAGLGVGLPGIVSRKGARIHAYLPPGRWVDFDLHSALGKFDVPITAANNTICVSEFERRLGCARTESSFISILVRYGIGAAIYSNHSFLIGPGAFTGELGHLRVGGPGGLRCICGRKGCLDGYASGRTWPTRDGVRIPLSDRELALRTRYLAIGLADLLKVFCPPTILLNGIYNPCEAQIRPVLTGTLADELGSLDLALPKILFGERVELKASIGAALRAADEFLAPHLEQTVFAAIRHRRKGEARP